MSSRRTIKLIVAMEFVAIFVAPLQGVKGGWDTTRFQIHIGMTKRMFVLVFSDMLGQRVLKKQQDGEERDGEGKHVCGLSFCFFSSRSKSCSKERVEVEKESTCLLSRLN